MGFDLMAFVSRYKCPATKLYHLELVNIVRSIYAWELWTAYWKNEWMNENLTFTANLENSSS